MKLNLPFLCVALLGVGIWPATAASPRSFSEDADLDRTEAELAMTPSSVHPAKESDRLPLSAIAPIILPQKPIAQKPSSRESQELEVKLPPENEDQKSNSNLTVAPESDNLIADIPNAVLALPQGNEFRTDNYFYLGGGKIRC